MDDKGRFSSKQWRMGFYQGPLTTKMEEEEEEDEPVRAPCSTVLRSQHPPLQRPK